MESCSIKESDYIVVALRLTDIKDYKIILKAFAAKQFPSMIVMFSHKFRLCYHAGASALRAF